MSSMKKSVSIATFAILGSRLLGLVREQVFAIFFGASYALDAFNTAFRIPNLLRDLFAEGALSQSFVTVFTQTSASEGNDDKAWRLANHLSALIILSLGIFVILAWIFAPAIVRLLAGGFDGPTHELTVKLTRILLPFILLVSLAALAMGMLNSKNRYFLPQSASTFFNFTSIVIGLTCAFFLAPEYFLSSLEKIRGLEMIDLHADQLPLAITGMAIGTLSGGLIQWLIQLPSLSALGYKFRPKLNVTDPLVKKVLLLTGPAVIGAASVQINVMVNTYFASHMGEGSISYLNYAFRIMQFPLGVFGVAVATVSSPMLARLVAKNQSNDVRSGLQKSLRLSLFLSLPSTMGIIIFAHPIISLIYEHGRFNAQDSLLAAQALQAYATGIAGYSLLKIYQPAFLAYGDSKTSMRIALMSILLNFLCNYVMTQVYHLPFWALALGTGIVANTSVMLHAFLFRIKLPKVWDKTFFSLLMRMLVACLCMSVSAYYAVNYLQSCWSDLGIFMRLLSLGTLIFACGMIYLLSAHLLKVENVKTFIKRR